MPIKHNFRVGDKVTPKVKKPFYRNGQGSLGAYLKYTYGVDLNKEFEVFDIIEPKFFIRQGNIDCKAWSRTDLWSYAIVDLDNDDDDCL